MTTPWMQTRSGACLDIAHPDASKINIEEMAYSLAGILRYLNHTQHPYSVAEHCVRVSYLVEEWTKDRAMSLRGLLHDGPEYILGDITAPVKKFIRAHTYALDVIEDRWLYAILDSVGLPHLRSNPPMPLAEWEGAQAVIKRADLVMLATEKRDMMAPCERDWGLTHPARDKRLPPPLATDRAERAFLERFEFLTDAIAKDKQEGLRLLAAQEST